MNKTRLKEAAEEVLKHEYKTLVQMSVGYARIDSGDIDVVPKGTKLIKSAKEKLKKDRLKELKSQIGDLKKSIKAIEDYFNGLDK